MALHIDYEFLMSDVPQECINACSHPGPCDADVVYWVNVLELTVDRENAERCLDGYGAWDEARLAGMTDAEVAGTVLWLACGDFSEYDPDDDSCGSDVFFLGD